MGVARELLCEAEDLCIQRDGRGIDGPGLIGHGVRHFHQLPVKGQGEKRTSTMTREYRDRLIWAALVTGCAAPVAAAMWNNLDSAGHTAMAIGIAGWIAAIPRIEKAIQSRQPAERSRSLMFGTMAFIAIELIGWLAFSRIFVLALFWPAVWTGATVRLIPDNGSDFLPAFVLTVLCGAQVLGCAYFFGRVIARLGWRHVASANPA
jgi:hypothetical protein